MATTQWTGGNGNWTDPTWTNGVPDSTTDAIIDGTAASPVTVTFDTSSGAALSLDMQHSTLAVDSGTLALGSPSTLDALAQSGGVLDFAAGGTIDGPLSQTGGTLAIGAGETLNLERASALGGSIDGAGTLVTLGSTTISGLTLGGGLQWIDQAVFTTQTGVLTIGGGSGDAASVVNHGNWYITSAGADIVQGSAPGSSFTNGTDGVLQDGAPGTITVSGNFINRGQIAAYIEGANGTLDFNDGTFTSSGGVEAGSGMIMFEPDEVVTNLAAGTLTGGWGVFTGGTITFTGDPITTLDGSVSFAEAAGPGGEIGTKNTAGFTPIQQSLSMIATGGELVLTSTGTFNASNAMTLDGTLWLTDETFADQAGLAVGAGGEIFAAWQGGQDVVAGPIINEGTIVTYGAAGHHYGTLDLTGSLDDHGVLNAGTLGVIDISGAHNVIAGRVTGPGELLFSGGSSTIEPGAGGDIHTVALEEGATLALARNVADLYTFNDIATGGISTLDLAGHTARLSHSTFSGPSGGEALVDGGGTLAAVGTMGLAGAALDGGTTLANSRIVTQTGSVTLGDASGGTASIENLATGTYTMAGAVSLAAASATADTITNDGLFAKTGTGTATIGAAFTNAGTIDVTAGTLEITAPFTNTGSIIGTETQVGGTTYITAPPAALFNQYAAATKTAGSESLVHPPSVEAATPILAQPPA